MSEAQEIKLTPEGGIAPTPQNTPANNPTNSVLSRPHVPPTLTEEQEDENIPVISTRNAAEIREITSHPAFGAMVQGRLNSLVGRSSGYIESLPPAIRYRVTGLQGLQAEHSKIEAEFQREILELEKKFAEKYKPLYEKRRQIIEGKREPASEEIESGLKIEKEDADKEDEDLDEDDDEPVERTPTRAPTSEELASTDKGVPEFWLTALKNHLGLSEVVTDRDEEALKYLVDIRVAYPDDKPGFKLLFEFSEGAKAFFEPSILEKTYYYQDEVGYEGDFVYDHAVGTELKWVEGKDLTTKVETKKQRNKHTGQTRVVKKAVPVDSFFNFFKPPKPPADDDDDDIDDDIDEKLELDYQMGEDLKERVIPRAVDFFTGKALRYENDGESFGSGPFDDEDEDDDEDDDDDDLGGARGGRSLKAPVPPSGTTPGSAQDPQECKQQ